ncbi:MAG TPA: hypothetical protein PKM25_08320, partial [Candidatus Ozemobacteraceae bacterium]|nr:hypothetical protein [Candidatus Ozemobacteraceae bacterium]
MISRASFQLCDEKISHRRYRAAEFLLPPACLILLYGWWYGSSTVQVTGLAACIGSILFILLGKSPQAVSPAETARHLDTSFKLRDMLATAQEWRGSEAGNAVVTALLDDADNVSRQIRLERLSRTRSRIPLILAVILTILILLNVHTLLRGAFSPSRELPAGTESPTAVAGEDESQQKTIE